MATSRQLTMISDNISQNWPLLTLSVLLLVLGIFRRYRSAPTSKLPLPPGPPAFPIIGNFLDIPTKDMELTFRDLNKKYGDVVYLNACGQPMIVLGTQQAAIDLLEKRSANYSDRLFSAMTTLTGWTWLFSVTPYGTGWRQTRRLFHEYMNTNAVTRYQSIQEREAHRYLLRVLESPQSFVHHGRHLFGAVIIRVGYGFDVDKTDVDYIGIAEEAMATFSQIFLPGKYLVEAVPALLYLPSFMPGAKFKRDAAEWYPIVRKMRDVPWDAAVTALRMGRGLPSMASGLLERISQLKGEAAAEEEYSKNAIASAYAGGADTTLSTLQTFYLAMASYPEVQKRAQAELEAVIGEHRLPTLADKPDLPYINALVKECLRWRPVVPLALVHLSIEEDEYRGYRIPKGSSVVVNPWAYVRDPKLYEDPETFKPERFLKDGKLDPNVQDPSTIVFGYGRSDFGSRRICPGRHFAEAAVFIIVTSILHTFLIAPPLNKDGHPVRLLETVKMTYGVISYPEPFECIIKPRSSDAEKLIRESCKQDEAMDVQAHGEVTA